MRERSSVDAGPTQYDGQTPPRVPAAGERRVRVGNKCLGGPSLTVYNGDGDPCISNICTRDNMVLERDIKPDRAGLGVNGGRTSRKADERLVVWLLRS